jgi:hypothetical protein
MIITVLAIALPALVGAGESPLQEIPYPLVVVATVVLTMAIHYAVMGLARKFRHPSVPVTPAPSVQPLSVQPPILEKKIAPQEVLGPEIIAPEILAVIAAAVSVVLDHGYHIIDVTAAEHSAGMTSAWAIEGRFQHFSSHKFR